MRTVVERSAVVPYSPDAMFELVADVESYPEFLPWCAAATVRRRTATEKEATLRVAKGPLRIAFTTRNVMIDRRRLEIHLLEGPFTHLEGGWRFAALEDGSCEVSLHMEFEFSAKLVGATLSPVFEDITATMVQAFSQRADEIYGGQAYG